LHVLVEYNAVGIDLEDDDRIQHRHGIPNTRIFAKFATLASSKNYFPFFGIENKMVLLFHGFIVAGT
jgi:hypothetical protein